MDNDFKKTFNELRKGFFSICNNYQGTKNVTKREIQRVNIIMLYEEVIVILGRIEKELKELKKLERLRNKYERPGRIDPNSKYGKVISSENKQYDYLIVDIKSLLNWIYVIDNYLGSKTFPRWIRAFRNIFIVHFSEKINKYKEVRKLMHGKLISDKGLQLVYHPWIDSGFKGFKKFEKNLIQFIPELQTEKNYHTKVTLIWKNLDNLPGSVYTLKFRDELSKYGARSPDILYITHSLLEVLNSKVAKLFK